VNRHARKRRKAQVWDLRSVGRTHGEVVIQLQQDEDNPSASTLRRWWHEFKQLTPEQLLGCYGPSQVPGATLAAWKRFNPERVAELKELLEARRRLRRTEEIMDEVYAKRESLYPDAGKRQPSPKPIAPRWHHHRRRQVRPAQNATASA
jgi:hypothetical protein